VSAYRTVSEHKRPLLFPIRVDDAVLETKEAWARLLRDLKVEAADPPA
jgi:hypothetical protein